MLVAVNEFNGIYSGYSLDTTTCKSIRYNLDSYQLVVSPGPTTVMIAFFGHSTRLLPSPVSVGKVQRKVVVGEYASVAEEVELRVVFEVRLSKMKKMEMTSFLQEWCLGSSGGRHRAFSKRSNVNQFIERFRLLLM